MWIIYCAIVSVIISYLLLKLKNEELKRNR